MAPTRYFLAVNIARQTTALFASAPGGARLQVAGKLSLLDLQIRHRRNRRLQHDAARLASRRRKNRRRLAGWHGFQEPAGRGFHLAGAAAGAHSHRILWLEGLEPGFNRGGNVDSHARYIYIHGTGNETTLGRPDSHGCVHLAADDLMPLYDKVPEGTLVWIAERRSGLTMGRGMGIKWDANITYENIPPLSLLDFRRCHCRLRHAGLAAPCRSKWAIPPRASPAMTRMATNGD